jgi:hypothetical protein
MKTCSILLFLFVISTSSWPMEKDSTIITCPICAAKFKDLLEPLPSQLERMDGWNFYGYTGAPRPLPICPSCHFPYYVDKMSKITKDSILDVLHSQEYKACLFGNTSYYMLGTLLKCLNAKPLYIGYMFLQASRQIENDSSKYVRYLSISSEYLYKFLQSSDSTNGEYISIQILYGELLRRQFKLNEADSFFTIASQNKIFIDRPFCMEIINYELELIKNKDCSPIPIPIQDFAATDRENDTLTTMVRSLPGYDTLLQIFTIDKCMRGLINEAPYSLHVDLQSRIAQIPNAAWWFNPIVNNVPQYSWYDFINIFHNIKTVLSKFVWLSEWVNSDTGRTIEAQIIGITPNSTSLDWEMKEIKRAWKTAKFKGEPSIEINLRRNSTCCAKLFFGYDEKNALITSATAQNKMAMEKWMFKALPDSEKITIKNKLKKSVAHPFDALNLSYFDNGIPSMYSPYGIIDTLGNFKIAKKP